MKATILGAAAISAFLISMVTLAYGADSALNGQTVTLKGIRMNETHMREEADWDNRAGKGKKEFVFLIVHDGPPEIKAEVDRIWEKFHPGQNLDADAAVELEKQFKSRMLYYIDGPLAAGMAKKDNYGGGTPISVTGVVHVDADGEKWIAASSTGNYSGPTYPARVMAVDKPLVQLQAKPGLVIKLTDTLNDTLVYVSAGKFYMGCPLEQYPHWQEGPQHMVTFSKGFYLSDHPILNSEYAAVTGDTTRNPKNHPEGAAANMSCEMFDAYVKALQKLNPGKVFRAPSKSEWEYVARSGTSNLEFSDNPGGKVGEICNLDSVIKSTRPNGWGFYGICFSDGTERSCDTAFFSDHIYIPAVTDPRYPSRECKNNISVTHLHAHGGKADYPINELINDSSCVGTDLGATQRNGPGWKLIRQRILVEE